MKRWYVAQVYAGYEELVKKDLLKSIEEAGLSQLFGQILIPSAKLKQYFSAIAMDRAGKADQQQLFPGYILIEMEAVPEAIKLVASTSRVVRLLGDKDPVALSPKEVERITSQVEGKVPMPVSKSDFELDQEIEIGSGPFAGFFGIISNIDEHNERLTVMVTIFGRMTPVEIGFDQVKR
jgi:transcription termination/antitermination protein NusG